MGNDGLVAFVGSANQRLLARGVLPRGHRGRSAVRAVRVRSHVAVCLGCGSVVWPAVRPVQPPAAPLDSGQGLCQQPGLELASCTNG